MEGKHASQNKQQKPHRSEAFPQLDKAESAAHAAKPSMSSDFDLGSMSGGVNPVQTSGHGPHRFSAAPDAAYPGGKVPGGTAGSQKFAEGRRRNPAAIAALVVVALLLVVYVAGAVVFMGRFYPNTTLGNFDLSMKPFDQAVDELESAEKSYALSISGEGFSTNITAKQGGIQLDSDKVIAAAKGGMNPALWFVNMWGTHDATENLTASADSTALRNLLTEEIEEFNAGQTASEDAAIVYDAESHSYIIQPEVNGSQLDAEEVVQQAITAMLSMQDTLKIGDDVVIKPQVLSTDSRLIQGTEAANKLVACDVTLVAQLANTTEDITQINGDVISQWVTFDENYAPVFNEAVMSEWANALVASLNTVGSTRTYTRGDGKQVSVSGGDYGWAVDTSSLVSTIEDAVTNGSQGEISVPCSQTGNGFTAPGMDWGAYCDVDLTEQHARYYDASGNLLWESGIVSGKPGGGDATPTGTYYLKTHQSPSMLRGPKKEDGKYEWESEVQYWMPFVGNLVGLHDASWQPSSVFSNPDAYKTYGSHGCVNLPTDKAAEIYGIIQNGDPVIVHW